MTQIDRSEGLVGNTAIKAPCRVATTANIANLNGLLTVDGVVLVQDDRVLVKDQTSGVGNGIYVADTGDWQRAQDCDGALDLVYGSLVKVNQGAANSGFWYCTTTTDPIVVGTTPINFGMSSSTLAVISAFMQTLLDDADAAAAAFTLGIWGNNRLAKTANYVLANADKGKTIALGGTAFYTLTVNAAAGYDSNFVCVITNEDSGRGKKISINGITDFILWPKQSCALFNQNNSWCLLGAPRRWRTTAAGAAFKVDPVQGADTNDGLATGTGALATIQAALNRMIEDIDITDNNQPSIQLANGTYDQQVTHSSTPNGGHVIEIRGDPVTPSNVNWVTSGSGKVNLFVTDYGAVTLNGITLGSGGGGSTMLRASQFGIIDIGNCVFASNVGGVDVDISGDGLAKVNFTATNSINGNCGTFLRVLENGVANFASGFNFTQAGVNVGTLFVAANGGRILTNGGAITFGGPNVGTAGGVEYNISADGSLRLDGTTFPASLSDGILGAGGRIDNRKNSFSANKNAVDQTGIVTGTPTKITFGTELYDDGNAYDAANSKWIPPVGRVRVRATMMLSGGLVDGQVAIAFIYKNGAEFRRSQKTLGSANATSVDVECFDTANGTDYYEAYFSADQAGNKTVAGAAAYSRFEGELL